MEFRKLIFNSDFDYSIANNLIDWIQNVTNGFSRDGDKEMKLIKYGEKWDLLEWMINEWFVWLAWVIDFEVGFDVF